MKLSLLPPQMSSPKFLKVTSATKVQRLCPPPSNIYEILTFFSSCIPWAIFSPNPYYSIRKLLLPKLTSHPSELKFRSVECVPFILKQRNCSCRFLTAEFYVQYQASPSGAYGFLPPNIFSRMSRTKLMASAQWVSKITSHPTRAVKVWYSRPLVLRVNCDLHSANVLLL